MTDNDKFTVLITGGSRGIGRAVALKTAMKYKGRILINYLQNHAEAEIVKKMVSDAGAECVLIPANLLYEDEIEAMFGQVRNYTQRLDSFVHCAALTNFRQPSALKPKHFEMVMSINTTAFLKCVQMTAQMMSSGSIIAVSSLGSSSVVPYYSAMGPAKAALESLVRYFAAELAPKNIRVNCIKAGFIDTESIRQFPGSTEMIARAAALSPTGRIGTPGEVAEIALFLMSSEASLIIGQSIVADGGLSIY